VKIYMTDTGIKAKNGENLAWAAWADNLGFSLARAKG